MDGMKDSGIDWIGEIPEQWECEPLRYLVEQNGDTASYRADKSYVGLENIESWNGKLTLPDEADEVESQVGLFKEGDVLFGKLRPYLAKVVAPSFDGQSSTELIVMTPRRVTTRYLHWLLLNISFIRHIDALTYGVKMPRTSWFQLRQQYFPLPEGQEQDEISAFLDDATSKIDSKVDVLEMQIDVLERYKKSVIHEAVTKGLDPNAPMKPSGVEWIGDIPEHWEKKRLKYFFQMQSGDNITSESIEEFSGFPVFGGNGLRGFTNKFNVDIDSILIGRQGALCGNVHFVRAPFWASDHAIIVKNVTNQSDRYYFYLLTDMDLNRLSMTAAQPGISVETVLNQLAILPPLFEQQEIADYLDEKCGKIDAVFDIKCKQIEVLKKRRQSLIYEYVTGKRRVEAGV